MTAFCREALRSLLLLSLLAVLLSCSREGRGELEDEGPGDPGPDPGVEVADLPRGEEEASDSGTPDLPVDSGAPRPSFPITGVEVDDHITYRLAHDDHPYWTGDLWPCTWGDDDRLYTACGDGMGFGNMVSDIVFAVVAGHAPDLIGFTPPEAFGSRIGGLWGDDPTLNRKPTGLTCVDGDIYLFSQNLRNGLADDPFGDAPYASVSVTRDHGKTWEYDAEKPMFSDHVFTTGFFLDYGKCQEHRRDDYEYVYGLDYNWRFSDDFLQTKLLLARVPRDKILERGSWELFTGLEGGEARWSADIADRAPVLQDEDLFCKDQSAIAQGHVVYVPQLNRYLYSSRAVCVWIFYEAPEPWGPWTRVSVQEWKGKWKEDYHAGYNVVVPSKYLDEDGLGGWAVSSLSSGRYDAAYYNMGFRRLEIEADLEATAR